MLDMTYEQCANICNWSLPMEPIAVLEDRLTELKATLVKVAAEGAKSPKFTRALMQTVGSALSASPGGLQAILYGLGGGAISGIASVWSESDQENANKLFRECLQQMGDQVTEITGLIFQILQRVPLDDDEVFRRVESPEYQAIIQKAFRDRLAYETADKKEHLRKLLTNAAAPGLLPDELIRIFIDWLRNYNDLHFKVMFILRELKTGTRLDIWEKLDGREVREDSVEADLFGVLIMDLNFGHVINTAYEKDDQGRRYKKERRKGVSSPYLQSRFDDDKELELTELGQRFIHYVMDEVVKKLSGV
jgi:hypothetical protein